MVMNGACVPVVVAVPTAPVMLYLTYPALLKHMETFEPMWAPTKETAGAAEAHNWLPVAEPTLVVYKVVPEAQSAQSVATVETVDKSPA